MGRSRDRIEDRPLFYKERVRAGFLAAARPASSAAGEGPAAGGSCYPAPTVLIDASQDPDTVFEEVKREVERVLAQRSRP